MAKVIYQVVSNNLLYHSKEPDKPRVVLLCLLNKSDVNVGEKAIHSIHSFAIKPGNKLLRLSDKKKTYLKSKLSEVKWL